MKNMNWVLGILLILTIIFLATRYSRKRRIQKLKKELLQNWGNPKNDEQFNFNQIGRYFANNRHKKNAFHIISEKTKADLDIDELFKYLDRTSSKIGQQYLYFKLRTIVGLTDLKRFDSIVKVFENDKDLSIVCQQKLHQLNSNDAYDLEELINGEQIEKPKTLGLSYFLSVTVLLCIGLGFVNPVFFLAIIPVYIINLVFHYQNKNNILYYLNGVKQLSAALNIAKNLSEYKKISDFYPTFPFLAQIGKIQFKTRFLGFEKTLDNEFSFLAWFLIEHFKILFNIEIILFFSFIDSITEKRESLELMYVFIGEVDSAISTASLKSNVSFCVPNFTDENKIKITEVQHPLIEDCIVNNLELENNSLLLTGSNMSGKTTFIRTAALNSLVAQTLRICFAASYTAPFFKLFSSIRISDNVLEDTSYYLQEVLNIKELLEASIKEAPGLFVLDEIFKGTNTIERISGGKAILSYLNKGNNKVIVSTHDIELVELLQEDNYELYHFTEQIEDSRLSFDYKLKKGRLKTRNAIKILELHDYPSEIIKSAKEIEQSIIG